MNKLIFPNGGAPLHGDDFLFVDAAAREALKGVVYPLAFPYSGNCILRGCEISFAAGSASITEGFALIGWEVVYVPAHSASVASLAASSLKLSLTYDPAGNDVFADSIARDTYEIRRGLITDGLSGGNEIVLSSPARIFDETIITSFSNSWAVSGSSTVKVRKFGDSVQFTGALTSGTTNLLAFVIPEGFRPANTRIFPITNNAIGEFLQCAVYADGNVILFTDGGEMSYVGKTAYLDNVHYLL